MNRMIAAAVAVLGLAGAAFAQTPAGPIQGVAAPGCAGCGAGGGFGSSGIGWGGGCKDCDPKFGVNPLFKKLMFWKKDTACGTCGRLLGRGGCLGNNCAGVGVGGAAFNPYPNGVPGTLVYPYNPYIRSPRDWFMQDK
jgi:hypothetical protein